LIPWVEESVMSLLKSWVRSGVSESDSPIAPDGERVP
jgi:hypothetical protein